MFRFFVLVLFLFIVNSSLISAQQSSQVNASEDSIRSVVNVFFEGMKNADTLLIRSTLAPSIRFNTILPDAFGNAKKCEEELVNEFLVSITKYPAGQLDERIEFETIKVDQMLATVWTPYKFYFKGNFLHCGVNCFQLLRYKEGWKIENIIDTRRKQDCK